MLTRWLVFNYEPGKQLRLKYSTPDEYIPSATRRLEVAERRLRDARLAETPADDPALRKADRIRRTLRKTLTLHYVTPLQGAELTEHLATNVVDLSSESDVAHKLLNAFLRAKAAAKLGMEVAGILSRGGGRAFGHRPLDTYILTYWFYDRSFFGLDQHTRTTFLGKLQRIAQVFRDTYAGLDAPAVVIADTAGRYDKVAGYAMEKGHGVYGEVHVRFAEARDHSIDFMARSILHEATHKFGGTQDIAYSRPSNPLLFLDPVHRQRDRNRLQENADSYALAGMSLLKGGLVTHAGLA